MDFHFSIEKKHLHIFLVVFALLIRVLGVNAFSETFSKGVNEARQLGHSSDELVVKIAEIEYTQQEAIDNGIIAGPSEICHWEESWLDADGEPIPNGDNANEKTACDVGECRFKMDGQSCNPGSATCSASAIGMNQCGGKTGLTDEHLYCCETINPFEAEETVIGGFQNLDAASIEVAVIFCDPSNCNSEDSANEICSDKFGEEYYGIAVDCAGISVPGGNHHWDRDMDTNIDWCSSSDNEDYTVTCAPLIGKLLRSEECDVTSSPDYFDGLNYDACDQGPSNFRTAFADCNSRKGSLIPFPFYHNTYFNGTLWSPATQRTYWTSNVNPSGYPAPATMTTAGKYESGSWGGSHYSQAYYWRCIED